MTGKRITYIYVYIYTYILDFDIPRMNYLVLNYTGKDTGDIISICFVLLL